MKKDVVKIVHVSVLDGDIPQIEALQKVLGSIKKKLPYNVEFLITNDKIKFRDVRQLIDELYKLYKMYEKKVNKFKKLKGEKK